MQGFGIYTAQLIVCWLGTHETLDLSRGTAGRTLGRWRQEGQGFKVIFGDIASLRPNEATSVYVWPLLRLTLLG